MIGGFQEGPQLPLKLYWDAVEFWMEKGSLIKILVTDLSLINNLCERQNKVGVSHEVKKKWNVMST